MSAPDPRLRPLPAPLAGVRLWTADLQPREGDAAAARPDAADRARLAVLPAVAAHRLLARRVLLRSAVAAVAGCAPQVVRPHTGPGPRRVAAAAGTWWVSSSSSGDLALLAVAEQPVGVDVEALPGPPDALLVSGQLLTAAEDAWIRAGGSDAPGRFLRTWVRKEAVVKCTGEGLARDLRGFTVDAAAEAADVVAVDAAAGAAVAGLRTHALAVDGHVAALALGAGSR